MKLESPIKRRASRQIFVGDVAVGGDAPISVQSMTNTDGVFVTIELPPGQERYLQVWGFVDDADLADGEMTLLAEVPTPIIADAVVTVSLRPLQQ